MPPLGGTGELEQSGPRLGAGRGAGVGACGMLCEGVGGKGVAVHAGEVEPLRAGGGRRAIERRNVPLRDLWT
jgi:hypothetical protein